MHILILRFSGKQCEHPALLRVQYTCQQEMRCFKCKGSSLGMFICRHLGDDSIQVGTAAVPGGVPGLREAAAGCQLPGSCHGANLGNRGGCGRLSGPLLPGYLLGRCYLCTACAPKYI